MKRILIFILCLAMMLFSSTLAFAEGGKYDYDFFSSNNIDFYNPEDTGCGGETSSTTTLTGSDNEQKIYNYWITAGYSPDQAAGITGGLQEEGGFNPFWQDPSQTWPSGGYGIADFTTNRSAVTQAISTAVGSANFKTYYAASNGAPTTASTGFVPSSVPLNVNDGFLLAELNYLASLIQGLTPNPTYASDSKAMTKDFPSLTIASGKKLSTYIESLTDSASVAEAWTYLYELPSTSMKSTDAQGAAIQRSADAATILAKYTNGDGSTTTSCSSIGTGGLTYVQAVQFDADYFHNKAPQFLKGTIDAQGAIYGDQCTAFSDYINAIINAPYNSPNGQEVVGYLLSHWPNAYTSVTDSGVKPFTTYSWTHQGVGHTGVILGIETDGSVVIGEQNVALGKGAGLIESTVLGKKDVDPASTVATEHWKSLSSYVDYIRSSWGYTGPAYAAPKDASGALQKIQKVLGD